MKRYRRASLVCVPELPMRSALPDFREPELFQKCHDLARLQDGQLPHGSRYFDGLCPDEHALKSRVAFLEQHLDDFLKVGPKFIERLTLAVRTGESRNPTHVQAGVGVLFDDGCEVLHVASLILDDTRR